MSGGYVKFFRQLMFHEIWLKERFTQGQAWADLIMMANHKKGRILVRGIHIEIDRGQVGWSEISLSNRWKWSRGKCRRFVSFLEQQNMLKVEQQKNCVSTIMTILNYDRWQGGDTTDSTANDTADGQQTVQQTDTNKKYKKNKENIPLPPSFGGIKLPAYCKTQEVVNESAI